MRAPIRQRLFGGAAPRRLDLGRTNDLHPRHVGLELREQIVLRSAAVDLHDVERAPCVGAHRVDEIPDLERDAFALEQRPGKADIIRLSFGIDDTNLEEVITEPANFMETIHQYCVAPLRRVYAEVYRINKRR